MPLTLCMGYSELGLVHGAPLATPPQWSTATQCLRALNAVTHELITVTTDAYINSQHVCRLLYRLAARNLTVPITVVLDNARYQRCHRAGTPRSTLNTELLFLPTYSPQFNLIERFWKLVKKTA